MMHHPDATKYVYHGRLNVYQLYKNTPAWHGQLPGARATDDVGRDRPGAQQTLAATPTLTMVMPLPHREAGLLLCRSSMAWGWLSETRGSGGSRPAQVENGPAAAVELSGDFGLLEADSCAVAHTACLWRSGCH